MAFIIKNILFYTLLLQFSALFVNAQRYCNGYESYCNKAYNEIAYPTTHNSFSVGKSYSANQELPIAQQLNDGIRGLMLDVFPHEDGTIHFCHTKCTDLYLDAGNAVEILSVITSFLQENPSEVITIFIENYNGNVPAYNINEIFTNSGLVNYVYTPSVPGSWPTLGEMIDNHQNVVVFSDKLTDPAYPWYLSLNDYVTYNNFVSVESQGWDCEVYGGYGDLFLLYHMKHVQVLNSGYLPDTTIIDKTNSLEVINEHIQYCQRKINYIAVDYYNHGDIVEFVTRLNGEEYDKRKMSRSVSYGISTININNILSLLVILISIFLFY